VKSSSLYLSQQHEYYQFAIDVCFVTPCQGKQVIFFPLTKDAIN
jgi:hypothetical protein